MPEHDELGNPDHDQDEKLEEPAHKPCPHTVRQDSRFPLQAPEVIARTLRRHAPAA
jgi:hypothetical protein